MCESVKYGNYDTVRAVTFRHINNNSVSVVQGWCSEDLFGHELRNYLDNNLATLHYIYYL